MLINVPPIDRSPRWSQELKNGTYEKTIRRRVQGMYAKANNNNIDACGIHKILSWERSHGDLIVSHI